MASSLPVLVVRSAARFCAVPLEHVVEIMRPLPVDSSGQAPAFVLGLSILRGNPVAVVDLGKLLGDKNEAPPSRYVALRVNDRRVALAVDDVVNVRTLDASILQDMPPLLQDDHGVLETIGTLDARLLLVLRASRLIPEGLSA